MVLVVRIKRSFRFCHYGVKSKEILRSGDNTYLWIEGLDVKRNNDVSKMYNALQFGREHRESTWHTFDNCANCASRWAAESSSVASLDTEATNK